MDVHTTGSLAGIATHGSAVCMTCTWSVDLTAVSCGSASAANALDGIMTLASRRSSQGTSDLHLFGLDDFFSS